MRMRVRWWLTAGCEAGSPALSHNSSHRAETCSSPSRARARTICRRDLSASILKTSVSRLNMLSGIDRGKTTDVSAGRDDSVARSAARLRTGETGCERKETPPPVLLGATGRAAVDEQPAARPVLRESGRATGYGSWTPRPQPDRCHHATWFPSSTRPHEVGPNASPL